MELPKATCTKSSIFASRAAPVVITIASARI
jgi:hypothetical protein